MRLLIVTKGYPPRNSARSLQVQKVAEAMHKGEHGSTFAGGPLVTSVAQHVVGRVRQPAFLAEVEAKGNLLASAEAAGLKPAFGCRMGICNTCVCTKVSGTVRNLATGELNDQNNVQIKLCVSEAVSPVQIDL